ncbi:hypothetical protein L614_003000000230 [Ochrobactrum sp. J50]|nr:hypothetical protein L614_003000000230 [Ochrobactrum sp. J50]
MIFSHFQQEAISMNPNIRDLRSTCERMEARYLINPTLEHNPTGVKRGSIRLCSK